jgi:signal transduction histidine kinase
MFRASPDALIVVGTDGVIEVAGPATSTALRDALSNVGRHARASAVDVAVSVAEGSVTLTVSDDAVPIGDENGAANGLADMIGRATAVGGVCTVTARSPAGTPVRWSVPMDAA